ncbi:MAG: glutathione S-transferase N-terminal domain-containing protein [Candidatus Peregrinibacteria bacterium]|nr:glutathione S-transferase N-terminal domain-containing protein [Candidatus Peregrinibacteria bacterium]
MLLLFHKESCPYCAKVRDFMESNEIDYVSIDSEANSPSRDILAKLGGKSQVPFLVDTEHGEMMYESDEIISYLNETC